MDELKIKEAFAKAKQDIQDLKDSLYYLLQEIEEIKRTLISQENPTNQQTNNQTEQKSYYPTQSHNLQAFQHSSPTQIPTDKSIPTHKLPLEALKTPNSYIYYYKIITRL